MPERSKGADLRSAGRQSAWVRTPLQAHLSQWPNGQGVGFRSRRLWVRVPSGMAAFSGRWIIFYISSGSRLRNFINSCSLEAEHRSYEPGVAGSIPAWSILSACSVMVIIDASQALDPGSIPGRRTRTFYNQNDFLSLCYQFPGFA